MQADPREPVVVCECRREKPTRRAPGTDAVYVLHAGPPMHTDRGQDGGLTGTTAGEADGPRVESRRSVLAPQQAMHIGRGCGAPAATDHTNQGSVAMRSLGRMADSCRRQRGIAPWRLAGSVQRTCEAAGAKQLKERGPGRSLVVRPGALMDLQSRAAALRLKDDG